MAIKSNDSTQEVVGSGIKMYSGLSNFNVIAVNPTMDELHKLGIMVKSEPNYFVEFGGEENFKLTFWVKNEDLTTNFSIFMRPEARVSEKGKNQWINNLGQTAWHTSMPSEIYDWWKPEGGKKALKGEETLVEFAKAWANVASGDEVYFEGVDKLAKGDASEVKALVPLLAKNQVRLLIGVKDGKYQAVYTKFFGRIKPQRDQYFVTKLNDDFGAFKNAEFAADLVWGEFSPQLAAVVAPDTDDLMSEAEDWS